MFGHTPQIFDLVEHFKDGVHYRHSPVSSVRFAHYCNVYYLQRRAASTEIMKACYIVFIPGNNVKEQMTS